MSSMTKMLLIDAAALRGWIAKAQGDVKIAHQAGYAFYGGRWHKVTQDKPAPKGAPKAAHPEAAGAHGPQQHFTNEQWEQLKLPPENVNAPSYNAALAKLKEWSDAGNVTAIVGAGYGTNTYGKKLAAIANQLLTMHSSPHKVEAGQKAGTHAGVQGSPAPAASPEQPPPDLDSPEDMAADHTKPAAAPAGTGPLQMPDFEEGKTTTGVKAYYEKAAQKILDAAAAGDVQHLDGMIVNGQKPNTNGKVSNTWAGKTANSKKLLALHAAAMAQAGGTPEAKAPAPPPVEPPAPAPAPAAAPEPTPDTGPLTPDQLGKLQQIPWHTLKLPDSNSNAASVNKKLKALQDAAFAGDVAAIEAMTWGQNTYNKKLAVAAQAALLALKDGGAPAPQPAAVAPEPVKKPVTAATPLSQTQQEAIDKMSAADLAAIDGSPGLPPNVQAAITAKLAAQGPKEGDTKPGADGMLVFQNGRWHKQGAPAPAVKALSPSEAIKVMAAVKAKTQPGNKNKFKAMAVAGDAAGLQDWIDNHSKGLSASKMVAQALLNAMTGGAGVKPAPAAATPVAAPPTAPPSAPGAPEPIAGWTQLPGTQGGYTDGSFYVDPTGQKWYCKFHSAGEDGARAEVLALKLYEAAGQNVPEMKVIHLNGKVGTASKVIDGLTKKKDHLQSGKAHAIFDGFAADAWLANWDTVGNNPAAGKGWDNMQFTPDGKVYRIDAGGALHFKGTGAKKSADEWSDKVIELKTLLDPVINANTAKAFAGMSEADKKASVAKVLAIPVQTIESLVNTYGPGTSADKKALVAKLLARQSSIADQYPDVAVKVAKKAGGAAPTMSPGHDPNDTSWVRLNPGEKIVEHGSKFGVSFAKIEVPAHGFNAATIPKPFVYNKSSSKFVNDQNTADIQSIYDLAVSGAGPDSVSAIQFPEIVKATGDKTGKMLGISEHPSKIYVQEYLNQVVGELKAQLQPTYRVVNRGSFSSSYSEAAKGIAAKVKALAHSQFSAWADKAADYLVLDRHSGNGIPTPQAGMFKNVKPSDPEMADFKARSDASYAKLNSAEKQACVSYTGSAYHAWNAAMRLGETGSSAFKGGEPMRAAFKKAAVDLPEGIILHRGLGVGSDTYKGVIGAVIQDGSFQSTSYGDQAAFSSYNTQLRLHVGKGVKGLMATSFSKFGTGEREVILHPNTRYLVMNVEKGANGKTYVDVLVLPHEDA